MTQLLGGGLLSVEKKGRHRYYHSDGDRVALFTRLTTRKLIELLQRDAIGMTADGERQF